MDNNRYANGKIYKIVNLTNNEIYIGSTCEPTLAHRLAKHVCAYKRFISGKSTNFMTSFKILEGNNYDIQLIEAFPCNSKDELHSREGYYIRNNQCTNKQIAGRTHKQYYEEHPNKKKENKKRYYEKNKERLLQERKQQQQCECGSTYSKEHKNRHLKTQKHIKFIDSQNV